MHEAFPRSWEMGVVGSGVGAQEAGQAELPKVAERVSGAPGVCARDGAAWLKVNSLQAVVSHRGCREKRTHEPGLSLTPFCAGNSCGFKNQRCLYNVETGKAFKLYQRPGAPDTSGFINMEWFLPDRVRVTRVKGDTGREAVDRGLNPLEEGGPRNLGAEDLPTEIGRKETPGTPRVLCTLTHTPTCTHT